jgi:2-polyprenyl-6-methoxyphenol hydroxylase-like FAD-dependent oxidoreductase
MKIPGIIIGGGIAGLTAAIAMQRLGTRLKVYESAPEIKPLGAGIWMAPNAMQVFHRLGVADKINAGGVPLNNIQVVDDGMRPIMRTNQERVRQKFGCTTTAIRRSGLQEILLSEIDPGDVLLSKTCVSITEEDDNLTVNFSDGTSVKAGFVIAADGIHSAVREQIFPGVKFAGTGHIVWRGISAINLKHKYKKAIMEAWAHGVRFGFSEIADGMVDWFVVEKGGPATLQREGLKERLQDIFKNFAYPLPDILQAADEQKMIRNEITDFDPIPKWSKRNICLIGDAAHASTPYMGQGGCQAVEDAYVIAKCLHEENNVERAFEKMQQLRRKKALHIVRTSRIMGRAGYLQHTACALRNFVIRSTPPFIIEMQFRKVYSLNY